MRDKTILDQAVARPLNRSTFQGLPPPPSMEMDGLLRGLSSFNPALGQYTDAAIQHQRIAVQKAMDEATEARAAHWDPNSQSMEQALAADLPENVPAAHGGLFRDQLGKLLVDRVAVKAKTGWAAAYEEARKAPDFDPERFISEQRGKTLAGLNDPGLAGRMGHHLNQFESAVRVEAERDRLKKLDETTTSGLFSAFEENLRADMNPEQLATAYTQNLPAWRSLGRSSKELAGMLFQRVQSLSERMGGNPALFEVFDSRDPATGQSLLAMNPELADNVSRAREHAKAKQQGLLVEAAQSANVQRRVELDKLMETDPAAITPQLVQANMGKLGLFQSTDEAAAYLARARKATQDRMGDAAVLEAFDGGYLGRMKPEDQKKALEARLGPAITATWGKAVEGDGQAVSALAVLLMDTQNRSRATVPVEALERLVQTTVTTTHSTEGPPPAFTALAGLYKALSADPKFRSMYFKDDAAALMDAYEAASAAGSDPRAAYQSAYQSISPEAKDAARKLVGSPAFSEKLKAVTDSVTGVGWAARWTPFGTEPSNGLQVQTAAQEAVRQYLQRTPWATEKQAVEYVSGWTARNFVLDSNTGTAVRVPDGSASWDIAEAFSEYSKRVSEAYRLHERNDGEWAVQFRAVGDGNVQQVVLTNGAAEQHLGALPLESLRQAALAEKTTTPQDVAVLHAVQQQFRGGKLDLAYLQANAGTLAKAERLELLPKETLKAIDKARQEQALAALAAVPALSFGPPTLEHLANVPTRGAKVDRGLTSDLALRFATAPVGSPADIHQSLAASLVTMGEAVVLRASPDPAKDAGMNLGMGYNLKANGKTAREDLVRAGVSAEKVDAVICGDAQLTPHQASKLLMVALPRYEKLAREAAEETAPGLWNRMTPPQKAVMVDVAWQTGNPEQFRKAWDSLARGDTQAFAKETVVFYTSKSGERVEDKRRGELRAAMLAGHGAWVSAVQRFGSFPSTAIAAQALNQK